MAEARAAQRLDGSDANFLYLETPSVHMHIGFTAVFERPPDEEFTLEDLRALVSSRLDRLAVLRRRLREVPFGLHHPVWIDDSRFDVEYHVRRSTVADPGGREELGEVVAAILSRPLDRSRPLWELHLVEGLADDRFALVTKVHHAAVDGVSGIELMTILLSPEPSQVPERVQPLVNTETIPNAIPGPAGPLYCANSAMTALYPTGPLGEGAGLNITLGSYAGQLNISLITCPEVVPDGARIARDLQDELTALVVATRG